MNSIAELVEQVREATKQQREILHETGTISPEVLEELAREDAEAEALGEIARRAVSSGLTSEEKNHFSEMIKAIEQRDALRAAVLASDQARYQ